MDAKAKTIVAEDHCFEALPAPDRSLKMPTIEASRRLDSRQSQYALFDRPPTCRFSRSRLTRYHRSLRLPSSLGFPGP